MRPDPTTNLMPYKGVVDCGMKIVRAEGPRRLNAVPCPPLPPSSRARLKVSSAHSPAVALWTGFGAYYGRCAPHAMTILLTLEQLNVYALPLARFSHLAPRQAHAPHFSLQKVVCEDVCEHSIDLYGGPA